MILKGGEISLKTTLCYRLGEQQYMVYLSMEETMHFCFSPGWSVPGKEAGCSKDSPHPCRGRTTLPQYQLKNRIEEPSFPSNASLPLLGLLALGSWTLTQPTRLIQEKSQFLELKPKSRNFCPQIVPGLSHPLPEVADPGETKGSLRIKYLNDSLTIKFS